jgi:hypothetical protein
VTKRAFIYVPGFLDHPHWSLPLLHHKLFPSQEVYVAVLEDGRNNRALQVGFGGTDEIKSLLLLLKAISEMKNKKGNKDKYESFGIIGNSRGGGVLIKTLALLNAATTNTEKDNYLKSLGITEDVRNRILTMLTKGCIVPRVPLKDMYQTIQWRSQNFLGVCRINKTVANSDVVKNLSKFVGLFLNIPFNYGLAPLLTWGRYTPFTQSPLQAINHLHGLKIKTLVLHTKGDEVIGNELDTKYVEELEKAFGKENVRHEYYVGDHTAANPELPEFSEYVNTTREFLAQ